MSWSSKSFYVSLTWTAGILEICCSLRAKKKCRLRVQRLVIALLLPPPKNNSSSHSSTLFSYPHIFATQNNTGPLAISLFPDSYRYPPSHRYQSGPLLLSAGHLPMALGYRTRCPLPPPPISHPPHPLSLRLWYLHFFLSGGPFSWSRCPLSLVPSLQLAYIGAPNLFLSIRALLKFTPAPSPPGRSSSNLDAPRQGPNRYLRFPLTHLAAPSPMPLCFMQPRGQLGAALDSFLKPPLDYGLLVFLPYLLPFSTLCHRWPLGCLPPTLPRTLGPPAPLPRSPPPAYSSNPLALARLLVDRAWRFGW